MAAENQEAAAESVTQALFVKSSRIDPQELWPGLVEEEKPAEAVGTAAETLPESVTQTLFVKSSLDPQQFKTKVEGYHFSKPDQSGSKVDYHALLQSFKTCGFQATNFGLAVDQINQMVSILKLI